MLDQNTDRMWFVIGAVIVGAAIIFIANGTLPTLFASVSESFEESAEKGTEVIDDLSHEGENLIDLTIHSIVLDHRVDHFTGEMVHNDVPSKPGAASTWYSTIANIDVIPGEYYRFSAPAGLASPIIGYFDEHGNTVGHHYFAGEPYDGVILRAPNNAKYANVSAGDIRLRPGREVSPVGEWEFRQWF